MIKVKNTEVAQLFNHLVSEDGFLIGARNDRAMWSFLLRHLRLTGDTLHQSSILVAIEPRVDIFGLKDVEEFAFIIDNKGVVRAKRTASGLWNLFFHKKK